MYQSSSDRALKVAKHLNVHLDEPFSTNYFREADLEVQGALDAYNDSAAVVEAFLMDNLEVDSLAKAGLLQAINRLKLSLELMLLRFGLPTNSAEVVYVKAVLKSQSRVETTKELQKLIEL